MILTAGMALLCESTEGTELVVRRVMAAGRDMAMVIVDRL